MTFFDIEGLSPVVVVCGHYGVGKTAFALSLAAQARLAGKRVTLADLDVVNPYFRSSDQAEGLAIRGIELLAPAFSGPGNNLDSPALTAAVAPAIEQARRTPGSLLIIDAGGDDAGATALGRYADQVAAGKYSMLYVANRYRSLTPDAQSAKQVLDEIERASRLRATGIVNNSHLMADTTLDVLAASQPFASSLEELTGLDVVAQTVPKAIFDREGEACLQRLRGPSLYVIEPYAQTAWDAA